MSKKFTCPICGYKGLKEPPRTLENGASHENCQCCGFEFGYDDEVLGWSYEAWRARWVEAGMRWESSYYPDPPVGWDPQEQLRELLAGPPVALPPRLSTSLLCGRRVTVNRPGFGS